MWRETANTEVDIMQTDIVLDGYVKNDFATHWGLSGSDDDFNKTFEVFAAYTLLRKMHKVQGWDPQSHIVDGGGDGGIDAICILLNGSPVFTLEAVRSQMELSADNSNTVQFVFMQATTKPAFEAQKMINSVFGVERFFHTVSALADPLAKSKEDDLFNDAVSNYIRLALEILHVYPGKLRDVTPLIKDATCSFYYATRGTWDGQREPAASLRHLEQTLKKQNLSFSRIEARAIDAAFLREAYGSFMRSVTKTIDIAESGTFPAVPGVDHAYVGLVRAKSFLELVSTDDGDLNDDLFYDNVRAYQGDTKINKEIALTLKQSQRAFPLYNNGVTIVAHDIHRVSNSFQIQDFQIVNGCQTTNVLFENKDLIGDDTVVPLKLIATKDRDVVTNIIRATNSQTAIEDGVLESQTTFLNRLEDWYNTAEKDRSDSQRIYFERRSKQYARNVRVKNIVSLREQAATFIGMFLDAPHNSQNSYPELYRIHESELFLVDPKKSHSPAPYYASGVASVAVDRWLRSLTDTDRRRDLQPYKYHLLMLLRVSIAGADRPPLNSKGEKGISAYCDDIVALSRDDVKWAEACGQAADSLAKTQTWFAEYYGENNASVAGHRDFSAMLLGRDPTTLSMPLPTPDASPPSLIAPTSQPPAASADPSIQAEAPKATGTILWYQDAGGYGRIKTVSGTELLLLVSELGKVPPDMRKQGTKVLFRVGPKETSRGRTEIVALEVQIDPTTTA